MNNFGVRAICVFDGKERSLAKAHEVARRKQIRQTDVARSTVEAGRLRRLQKLAGLLQSYRSLNNSQRDTATACLRKAVIDAERLPDTVPSGDGVFVSREFDLKSHSGEINFTESDIRDILLDRLEPVVYPSQDSVAELADRLRGQQHDNHGFPQEGARRLQPNRMANDFHVDPNEILDFDDISLSQLNLDGRGTNSGIQSEITDLIQAVSKQNNTKHSVNLHLPRENNDLLSRSSDPMDLHLMDPTADNRNSNVIGIAPRALGTEPSLNQGEPYETAPLLGDNTPRQLSISPTTMTISETQNRHPLLTEDVTSALALLYLDYRQCMSELTSLMASAQTRPPSTRPADAGEAQAEYVMSKSQHQLVVEEGRLWNLLADSALNIQFDGDTEAKVSSLAEKSRAISESYMKRSNPPTPQTYEECIEILRALGIPCVVSTGPFEAEALAASLVINGYADYVASEDTDVLVYEAPLIRNITNRNGPLVIVSGSDVRSVLQLDRSSWIDFALLLGTDFSQRIKNVGPQRALKFIRQHGSIEQIIENEPQYPPRQPTEQYLEQVEIARLVFQTLPPVPDFQLFQPGKSDDLKVLEILDRYGLYKTDNHNWEHSTALDGNYFQDDPNVY